MISYAFNLGFNLRCKNNEMRKPEDIARKIFDKTTKLVYAEMHNVWSFIATVNQQKFLNKFFFSSVDWISQLSVLLIIDQCCLW